MILNDNKATIAYARMGKSNSKFQNRKKSLLEFSNQDCPNYNGERDLQQQNDCKSSQADSLFSAIIGEMKQEDYDYLAKVRNKVNKADRSTDKENSVNPFTKAKTDKIPQVTNGFVSELVRDQRHEAPLRQIFGGNVQKALELENRKANFLEDGVREENMIYSHRERCKRKGEEQNGYFSHRGKRKSQLPRNQMEKYASKTHAPNGKHHNGEFLTSIDTYLHKLDRKPRKSEGRPLSLDQVFDYNRTVPLKGINTLHEKKKHKMLTGFFQESKLESNRSVEKSMTSKMNLLKHLENRDMKIKELKLHNYLLKNQEKKNVKKEKLMVAKMHQMLEHIRDINSQLDREKQERKKAEKALRGLQTKMHMPNKLKIQQDSISMSLLENEEFQLTEISQDRIGITEESQSMIFIPSLKGKREIQQLQWQVIQNILSEESQLLF